MCYAVVGPTGRATHSTPIILPFSAFILLIKSENFEKMVQNQCLTNIWSFWYGTCSLDRLQCSFLGSWSWESLTLIFSILAHVRSWRLCVLLMNLLVSLSEFYNILKFRVISDFSIKWCRTSPYYIFGKMFHIVTKSLTKP